MMGNYKIILHNFKTNLRRAILSVLPYSFRVCINLLIGRTIEHLYRFQRKNVGTNCYIDPSVQIIGYSNVKIGNQTTLSEETWLNVNHREKNEKRIIIGNNCHIGRRNFFSSGPLINIKDYCFTGLDCRFLGCGHNIDSPLIPYIASGLTPGDSIEVGINCWLTTNVTVMQGVTIGYGSVIGAGSIVSTDVPPFSIASGNPCQVLKRYDFKGNRWIDVRDWSEKLADNFPAETEYLMLLKDKYSSILPNVRSASRRFGWI